MLNDDVNTEEGLDNLGVHDAARKADEEGSEATTTGKKRSPLAIAVSCRSRTRMKEFLSLVFDAGVPTTWEGCLEKSRCELLDTARPKLVRSSCCKCRHVTSLLLPRNLCANTTLGCTGFKMRSSRLGMHIGYALSTFAPACAFLPSPCVMTVLRGVGQQSCRGFAERPRGVPNIALGPMGRAVAGVPAYTRWPSRARHVSQSRLSMSSNQGMNPETFTERAWEAMVRLPALADSSKAQVTHQRGCVLVDALGQSLGRDIDFSMISTYAMHCMEPVNV